MCPGAPFGPAHSHSWCCHSASQRQQSRPHPAPHFAFQGLSPSISSHINTAVELQTYTSTRNYYLSVFIQPLRSEKTSNIPKSNPNPSHHDTKPCPQVPQLRGSGTPPAQLCQCLSIPYRKSFPVSNLILVLSRHSC